MLQRIMAGILEAFESIVPILDVLASTPSIDRYKRRTAAAKAVSRPAPPSARPAGPWDR